MIGNNRSTQQIDIKEVQFIIVYDKLTKPAAISLSNQLSEKYKCVVWDKKHFQREENALCNKNNIIFLNEDLVQENLANPNLQHKQIVPGIDYVKEGKRIGLVFNEETSPKNLSDILKENWKKYTVGTIAPIVLIGGVPGALITAWLLTLNQKKKIKIKLYMDAVDILAKSKIQEIING